MKLEHSTETFNPAEDHRWLGSKHATDTADTVTLDASAFEGTASFVDGVIPSGVVIGRITASDLYGPITHADVATAEGHLLTTKNTHGFTVDTPAAMIWHGQVIVDNLPEDHGLSATPAGDMSHIHYVGDIPADPA